MLRCTEWRRVVVAEGTPNAHWGAIVECPTCKRPIPIMNHEIHATGHVMPSVRHEGSCSFHENIFLVNWGPVPELPKVT